MASSSSSSTKREEENVAGKPSDVTRRVVGLSRQRVKQVVVQPTRVPAGQELKPETGGGRSSMWTCLRGGVDDVLYRLADNGSYYWTSL